MKLIITNAKFSSPPNWKIITSRKEFNEALKSPVDRAKIYLNLDWGEPAELAVKIRERNPDCVIEIIEKNFGEFTFLRNFLERIKYPAVVGMFLDYDPVIVYVNNPFKEFFGKEGRDLVGEFIDELIVPSESKEQAMEINRRVKDGEVVFVEVVRSTVKGARHFELTALPFSKEYVVAIYRDITEKKKVMEKIVESEKKYRGVFDASADPMAILNEEMRFVEVNKAFEDQLGGKRGEFLGKAISDIFGFIPPVEKEFTFEADVFGSRKIFNCKIKKINSLNLLRMRDITNFEVTNRLLRAIAYANDLIVRVEDKEELFEQSVKLLSDIDREGSCWIGIISEGAVAKVYCEGYSCAFEITHLPKCLEEALEKKKSVIVMPEERDKACPFYTKKELNCLIAPLIINGDIIGFNVLHSPTRFSLEMKEFFESVTNNIAIKAKAIDAEKAKKIAFRQIEDNIVKLAILVDEIRNPLAALLAYAELMVHDDDVLERIKTQVWRIDRVLGLLDRGWIESEKVREFLKKSWGINNEAG